MATDDRAADDGAADDKQTSVVALVAPVGLAFIPLGIALGLLVVHAGLQWWWAPVFAGVIYAGSLEFVMVGLAAASAPLATVAVTSFIVNLRHVFYALSFPLHRVKGVPAKLYSTYTLSDEAYAVAVGAGERSWTSRRILLMQGAFQLLWVAGTVIGALIASAVPVQRLQGLDFALTALFIVLAIDAYRAEPNIITAASAVACAVAATILVPDQMLVWAFAAFTGVLVARFAIERRRSPDA